MPVSQLSGGAFSNILGVPYSQGVLELQLNQDAVDSATSSTQVCSAKSVRFQLDNNGNVSQFPAQFLWPNSALTPNTTFYLGTVFNVQGVKVWGPNALIVGNDGSLSSVVPSNPA